MKYKITTGLMLLVCSQVYAAGNVTNFETKGNLAATKPVGCVTLDKLDNTYTPADLYPGMAKCLEMSEYKKAAYLFAIAGVFGRFDVYRVSDRTAHQATRVLLIQTFGTLSMEKKQAFRKVLHGMFNKGSASLKSTCAQIDKIGHPTYYPAYMIQHGMNAFTGNAKQDALVKDFDAKQAWRKALESYMHCSGK